MLALLHQTFGYKINNTFIKVNTEIVIVKVEEG